MTKELSSREKWTIKKREEGYVDIHLFAPKETVQAIKDAKRIIMRNWKSKKGLK
jgi:hypothetical protein